MRDIPVFTTENGAASLFLSQIPSRKAAFVQLQSSAEPEKLLKDCTEFCIACGAEVIYACGDPMLETYPEYCQILRMQRMKGENAAPYALWPMLPENKERWRSIYNAAMEHVDNAKLLSYFDMDSQLRDRDCYFVHKGEEVLGIGKASDGEVKVIVSTKPGAGQGILETLISLLHGETVTVTVASTNERAIRLYEKAGFLAVGAEKTWYKISK